MQSNLITPQQIKTYLDMGLQITLHWTPEDWQIYEDVLCPTGEAAALLYTYIEHNSYDSITFHPNGPSLYQVYPPTIKCNCDLMKAVLASIYETWVDATMKEREKMIMLGMEILSLRLESDHYRRLYENRSSNGKSAK